MTEAKLSPDTLSGRMDQDKQIVRIAILLSVLLHIGLVGALHGIDYTPEIDVRDRPDREIEVFLVPDVQTPAAPDDGDMPKTYTSVPDRHAVPEAPDDPDYLALHHSVAADNKLGDAERPSADEEGEFEQVEIRREDLSGSAGVQYAPMPAPQREPDSARRQAGAPDGGTADIAGDRQTPAGAWALPEQRDRAGGESEGTGENDVNVDQPDLAEWWGGPENPSILRQGQEGPGGDRGFDFNQNSMGTTTSGVAIVDDLRLSTVAWDWAPWVQEFGNQLHRHWVPPYAYGLGLLTGTTVVRLVVEKDGRPSTMEILETEGHQSLHDASLAALKAFAPYLPLPATFPDKNLEIILTLHYPALRR